MAHDKEMGVLKPLETGAAADHNHDSRYYTESEIDTKLAKKSDVSHTHNNYALASHNHDGTYAPYTHTHDYTTVDAIKRLLDTMIPIGTVIFGAKPSLPGTWTQITDYRYVRIYSSNGIGLDAGLPNITGKIYLDCGDNSLIDSAKERIDGAFHITTTAVDSGLATGSNHSGEAVPVLFDASKSNLIYGNSDTVTPDTYNLTAWKKTAYEYS